MLNVYFDIMYSLAQANHAFAHDLLLFSLHLKESHARMNRKEEFAMKKHPIQKYVAPIIVTILFILYLVFYFGVLLTVVDGIFSILLLVIPFAMACVIIYVCVERIKEIRSGEEDDLGKY